MIIFTKKNPEIVIIIDAKRADIGSTNEGYTQSFFDYYGFDGVTVHPYLGKEAVLPFLERKDKGIIVLCRTSNPGAGEFQDMEIDGVPLYKIIADHVMHEWNENKNCLLVAGATYPEELATLRKSVGDDVWFLVPGIGAQGGDIEATVKAGKNSTGGGMIINSSRSIIFSDNPKIETIKLRDSINKFRY